MRTVSSIALLAGLCIVAPLASAATITVTTLEDVRDVPYPPVLSDLPGPDGRVSFGEAIYVADENPGPDTIEFAIPTSEYWLLTNMALLKLEEVFVLYNDGTTIDFTTQTAFAGDTNTAGGEVGIYGLQPNGWGAAAIFVYGNNNTIKGLGFVYQRGYGVEIQGSNNRVIGCTISGPTHAGVYIRGTPGYTLPMNNVIGGTQPGEGNVVSGGSSGVRIDGPSQDNIIIGNTITDSPYAGVEVRGAPCCPDYWSRNNRIGGPTPAERNIISGNGSGGEEGVQQGTQVALYYDENTIVEGNYIGTNADGSGQFIPNRGAVGVGMSNSINPVIRNNLISGIRKQGTNHYAGTLFGIGIAASGPATNITIQGNLIGTDATGTTSVWNARGIVFDWFQGYPQGGIIGGTNPGEANVIAFSFAGGIYLGSGVGGVRVSGNSIHSNGLIGIDLGSTAGGGPTFNDPGDADSGGNGLQNFPVLTSVRASASATMVEGNLNSTPNTAFTLEFFASELCDPSGFGEGRVYLGSTAVTTSGTGDAAFSVSLPVGTPTNWVVTATATRALTGDTSEFSPCFVATAAQTPCMGDADGDVDVDFDDITAALANFSTIYTSGTGLGDADHNGAVNFVDVSAVLGNFGAACS